jgi:hypothetical protein
MGVAVGDGVGTGVALAVGVGLGLGLPHPTSRITTAETVTARSDARGFTSAIVAVRQPCTHSTTLRVLSAPHGADPFDVRSP